jgi:hypothetical protein
MPAADITLVSLPPQSVCLERGFSENDWKASTSSPHLAQRYTYVGIWTLRLVGRRALALGAYDCQ